MRKAIIIALISVSSMYSADLPANEYNVILSYDPQVLEVGFISESLSGFDADVSSLTVDSIQLSYDASSNKGISDSCYVYWKILTASSVSISMQAEDLKALSGNTFSYTVRLSSGSSNDITIASGSDEEIIAESRERVRQYGSMKMNIETEELTGASASPYSGEIKVMISEGRAGGTV